MIEVLMVLMVTTVLMVMTLLICDDDGVKAV